MKKGIHPDYQETIVKCVCGNEFTTRSTLKEISVEICAACHPFFTGQQKLVDSAGRVERFMKKYGKEFGPTIGGGEKTEAKQVDEAEPKPAEPQDAETPAEDAKTDEAKADE